MAVARALYDNVAESADELAFRKGDILQVIEENTKNLEGWWLCALRGRRGMAPGNRLKIIDTNFMQSAGTDGMYDVPAAARREYSTAGDDYDVPPPRHQLKKVDDSLYDVPPPRNRCMDRGQNGLNDCHGTSHCQTEAKENGNCYVIDTKDDRAKHLLRRESDHPVGDMLDCHGEVSATAATNASSCPACPGECSRSSGLSIVSSDSSLSSFSGSNRSSFELLYPKDIYDVPSSEVRKASEPAKHSTRHGTAQSATSNLLEDLLAGCQIYDSPRQLQNAAEGLYDIPNQAPPAQSGDATAEQVMSVAEKIFSRIKEEIAQGATMAESVQVFAEFCETASSKVDVSHSRYLASAAENLRHSKQPLTDVQKIISYLKTNSASLLHAVPVNDSEWLSKHVLPGARLVSFYSAQIEANLKCLTATIDMFLQSVEKNEAPQSFIAHIKLVVVSAYKVVNIGDILHGKLGKSKFKQNILLISNELCESIKNTVSASKRAANNYPAVADMQIMVDCVVNVSQHAQALKAAVAGLLPVVKSITL